MTPTDFLNAAWRVLHLKADDLPKADRKPILAHMAALTALRDDPVALAAFPLIPTMTELQVEAALCVWEHLLETRDENPPLDLAWTNTGTATMRHVARSLGGWVCETYDLIPVELRDLFPYDWEVVPAIMGTGHWTEDGDFSHPPAQLAAQHAAATLHAQAARQTAARA